MDKLIKLFLPAVIIFIVGCSSIDTGKIKSYTKGIFKQTTEKKQKEVDTTYKTKKDIPTKSTKKKVLLQPPPLLVKDTLEEVDILEDKFVTLNVRSTTLRDILYILAKDLGLNVVISPDVDITQRLTLNFNKTPARTVLSVIEDTANVYFEVKDNILYVKAYMTKVFNVSYVHTISGYSATLGGDVLGASGGATGGLGGGVGGAAFNNQFQGTFGGGAGTGALGGAGGNMLTGNFQLTFSSSSDVGNFFDQLENSLRELLSENGKLSINKFTGTIIVTDKKENISKIELFLEELKKEITKQVLIEAKIVEVSLTDQFQYGIDWDMVLRNVGNASVSITQTLALSGGYGSIRVTSVDFSSVLNVLSEYANVETLSNPRIRVLNGQTALISTGTITPFWERQAQTLATGNIANQTVSYVRTNVLDGILLGVSPYIEDDGMITLNIVPVSTNIKGTKQLVVNTDIQAEAPILEIKEAGTTIRVKDGSLVIIGGLISKSRTNIDRNVPLLSSVPIVGSLFKQKNKEYRKKELIIFIRPKIINSKVE